MGYLLNEEERTGAESTGKSLLLCEIIIWMLKSSVDYESSLERVTLKRQLKSSQLQGLTSPGARILQQEQMN